MVRQSRKWRRATAVALGCLSLALVAVAAEASPPNADKAGGNAQALARAESAPAGVTPSPGTEDSLRRFIESEQNGQPNYEEMTPALAAANRSSQPDNDLRMQRLGALQSLSFSGKDPAGRDMDIFDARFENGRAEFAIGPLTEDGKVAVRSWRVLPTPEEEAAIKERIAAGRPDPERLQLLTRLIVESEQKGVITEEIMSPALVAAAKKQWPQHIEVNQRLGSFVSLQFLHVDQQGWDVYDATYQNGHAIWSVGPLTADHKLGGVFARF